MADQAEGRIEPHEVDPKIFATARDVEVDWGPLLQSAFEAPDMKTYLEQQAPPFVQYRICQDLITFGVDLKHIINFPA